MSITQRLSACSEQQKRLFFREFREYFASSPRSRVQFYYEEVALRQIVWYNPAVFEILYKNEVHTYELFNRRRLLL